MWARHPPSSRAREKGTHPVQCAPVQVARRVLAIAQRLGNRNDPLVGVVGQGDHHMRDQRPAVPGVAVHPLLHRGSGGRPGRVRAGGKNPTQHDPDPNPGYAVRRHQFAAPLAALGDDRFGALGGDFVDQAQALGLEVAGRGFGLGHRIVPMFVYKPQGRRRQQPGAPLTSAPRAVPVTPGTRARPRPAGRRPRRSPPCSRPPRSRRRPSSATG